MKEWLINGILIGTLNIPITYLRRHFYILSSDDYYFINCWCRGCIISIIYFFTYDSICLQYYFTAYIGIIIGVQKYLYINTRDVSICDPHYIDRTSTMLADAIIWGNWNVMCFGGGTIIVFGVMVIDNVCVSNWFNIQHIDSLPLCESLLHPNNSRSTDRNHQYIASIMLKTIQYISIKSIIYYNTDISLMCSTPIIFYCTISEIFAFSIIKISMNGPFILDTYAPVENIRDKVFSLITICILELCYDYGFIFILTYKPNIGYMLIILDTFRLIEEIVTVNNNEIIDLSRDFRIIGIIIYLYGAMFFYPTFIFLN